MSYKTFNGLMKHMRANSGLAIEGSLMKKQLMNMGYFHGYKGYRFFVNSSTLLPFKSFSQINETYLLDCKLKSIFYEKLMIIETSLKSRVLNEIMKDINSANLFDMYNNALESFNNLPSYISRDNREKSQKKKLALQSRINHLIEEAYQKGNRKIVHFYETPACNGELPIWAIFELLTFGVFGDLLSTLKMPLKLTIANSLRMPTSYNSNGKLLQDMVYLLRDLRNTVAHNEVCYDCRFRVSNRRYNAQVSSNVSNLLKTTYHLNFVNFNDIADYVALIAYLMRLIGLSKTETKRFVTQVEEAYKVYSTNIADQSITAITMPSGIMGRLATIKRFL